MTHKRTLAKAVAGLVLLAGSTLAAAAPAHAGDTGWNGTRLLEERPGQIRQQGDTGWNGT